MILSQFKFPQRSQISYHKKQSSFDFVPRNSSTLLVTIGDSWTWGADIDSQQDNSVRLSKVYGNQVAHHIKADFLNLSVGGSSNAWMANQFIDLVAANLNYKNIICVITWTEVGREFSSPWDQGIDYLDWTNKNIVQPSDYYNFLKLINECSAKKVQQALANTGIKLLCGTNFVDPIGFESLDNNFLTSYWLKEFSSEIKKEITDTCYVASNWVIPRFEEILAINPALDRSVFLAWSIELIQQAKQRIDLVSDQRYFRGIHHPTSLGHDCWADYILKHL